MLDFWVGALFGVVGTLVVSGIIVWVSGVLVRVNPEPNHEAALMHKRMRRALFEWLWEQARRDGMPAPYYADELIIEELKAVLGGE